MSVPPSASADQRTVLTGILFTVCGAAIFSINDLSVKSLSSDYALHQVILVRSLVSLAVLLLLISLSSRGFAQLRTRRPKLHFGRVCVILVSNMTYFLGLAALPLADAVAIAFVSPIFVTGLSVIFLGEKVGIRRWSAVAVGLLGVIVMLRPGAGVIQPAAILVLISAFSYATSNLLSRHMRETESLFAMSFYTQIGFLVLCTTMGLTVGDGHLQGATDPSLAFLLRGWIWPEMADWPYFIATGFSVVIGGLLVTQGYRMVQAAVIAPFEYSSMPLAILWGILFFQQWPDLTTFAGVALICGAGIYTAWRETVRRKERMQ